MTSNLAIEIASAFVISCTAAETEQDSNEGDDGAKGSTHFMSHVLIRVLNFLYFVSVPLIAPLELVD